MVRGSRNYWFHAKDPAVGFGWSSPASWQGWLVLATYVAVVLGGGWFPRSRSIRHLLVAAAG